jgi:predicted PurR-regulated permease PerM
MVDAPDLKSVARKGVPVQVRPGPPKVRLGMTTEILTYPRVYLLTQLLMVAALFGILQLHLLPALLGGLLIYHIVEFGSRGLSRLGVMAFDGKIILLAILAVAVVTAFVFASLEFTSYITSGPESFAVLMQRMADVVDTGRAYLPAWSQQYLPANFEELQAKSAEWLRENALHFGFVGKEFGMFLLHLVVGMIIGGLVALQPGFQEIRGPFSKGMADRCELLGQAFRRIVFSQIRISALNTFLTAIFLVVILPLTGNDLPLTKTMIAVTFIAGLLPIIGNLISNTVIVLISLSVSPLVAAGSLLFLVVIHKLEYFANAHIIGTQIRAKAWELLIAMVVMEAAFGIAGLVAAPIFYAYIKDELTATKMI